MIIISNIEERKKYNERRLAWEEFLQAKRLTETGLCIYKDGYTLIKMGPFSDWHGYGNLEELKEIVAKYEEINPDMEITLYHESE